MDLAVGLAMIEGRALRNVLKKARMVARLAISTVNVFVVKNEVDKVVGWSLFCVSVIEEIQ